VIADWNAPVGRALRRGEHQVEQQDLARRILDPLERELARLVEQLSRFCANGQRVGVVLHDLGAA
jgi:hypothetical protein